LLSTLVTQEVYVSRQNNGYVCVYLLIYIFFLTTVECAWGLLSGLPAETGDPSSAYVFLAELRTVF